MTGKEELRQALIEKLNPGVQIISELAPYANHLVVQDAGDRIGIRAGYKGNRGWAREELFYVEEEGRIVGDIASAFQNFTSIEAVPCNDTYLVIEGGGFRYSGCTFRNLTAEGGWVAWGVFGTNVNKNFRFEDCRLKRIDVHFHCWNLYIANCTIGFKGISVTGGGELVVENTTRLGNTFVNFRRDYGAKWDGPIRIRSCTLKPSSNGNVALLSMRPADFDYQYTIGLGTRHSHRECYDRLRRCSGFRSPVLVDEHCRFLAQPVRPATVLPSAAALP